MMNSNYENNFLPNDLFEALNFVKECSIKNEEKLIFFANKINSSKIIQQNKLSHVKKNKPFQRAPKKVHKIIQHAIQQHQSVQQLNKQLTLSGEKINVQQITKTTKMIPKLQSTKVKRLSQSSKSSEQMFIPRAQSNIFLSNQQQFTQLLNQQLQNKDATKHNLSFYKTTQIKVSNKQYKTPSTVLYNSQQNIINSNIVSQLKQHNDKQQQLDDMIEKWRGCYEYLSSFNKHNSNDHDPYNNKFSNSKTKVYDFTTNFNNNPLKHQEQQVSLQQYQQQSIEIIRHQKKFNHPPPSNISRSKPNYKQKPIKQTPLKYSISTSQTSAQKNNLNKHKTKQSQQRYSKLSKSILSSQNKQNSQYVINPEQTKQLNNFKYLDAMNNNVSNRSSYQNLTYLQQNNSSLDSHKYVQDVKNNSESDQQQSFLVNNMNKIKQFNVPSKTVIKNLNHFH